MNDKKIFRTGDADSDSRDDRSSFGGSSTGDDTGNCAEQKRTGGGHCLVGNFVPQILFQSISVGR